MPYVFLVPNFLFFRLFVFVPIVDQRPVLRHRGHWRCFPQRPFVGGTICLSFRLRILPLIPTPAARTTSGVASPIPEVRGFQVTAMVLLSLLTAVI
jgi:alpha-1,4-digalacturonate transport system permease protein